MRNTKARDTFIHGATDTLKPEVMPNVRSASRRATENSEMCAAERFDRKEPRVGGQRKNQSR